MSSHKTGERLAGSTMIDLTVLGITLWDIERRRGARPE
jgi:hypothetical protein